MKGIFSKIATKRKEMVTGDKNITMIFRNNPKMNIKSIWKKRIRKYHKHWNFLHMKSMLIFRRCYIKDMIKISVFNQFTNILVVSKKSMFVLFFIILKIRNILLNRSKDKKRLTKRLNRLGVKMLSDSMRRNLERILYSYIMIAIKSKILWVFNVLIYQECGFVKASFSTWRLIQRWR